MDNGHLHDDKLFRAVHDRLSDYEAPYNGADWDAMSRSLDKLPKTSRFQWKISLNSLIIGVAVAGLSVLAYVIAAGNGSAAPAPQAIQEVKNAPDPRPVKTTLPATTLPPTSLQATAPAMTDAQPTATETVATDPNARTTDASAVSPEKKKRNSKLLFGDQIDPRKGFIYQTQENSNIANQAPDANKVPLYDIDKNGNTKALVKDTATGGYQRKDPPKPQDNPTPNPETPSGTGAPVDGGFGGFGGDGQ